MKWNNLVFSDDFMTYAKGRGISKIGYEQLKRGKTT